MKIIMVAGARPNFMKIAPLMREMVKYEKINAVLVHTGQHYDDRMSKFFFDDLGIPKPDINLNVGSASHAVQTAEIMRKFEYVITEERPDLIIVVGDVNSTIACALTAAKLGVKIAHVEAGLRSYDRTMPEEINRILTDAISDYLFITEKSAEINLLKEGIPKGKIFFVGNVMIDTLLQHKKKALNSDILDQLGLSSNINYALLTLHRPSNVDEIDTFRSILEALHTISEHIPILFPCHPRTQKKLEEFGLEKYIQQFAFDNRVINCTGIYIIKPLGYLDFLKLMIHAKMVLTDSGGIQEEATILNVPCLTLRENTERPITVEQGTNILVGTDKGKIIGKSFEVMGRQHKITTVPDLWDGKAAERIVRVLLRES